MKNKRIIFSVLIIIIAGLLLSGCIPGDGRNTPDNEAGFFFGIWHGWIAPVSLIISIFRDEISIYEVNNKGLLYDFGYYIAIISGFGGLALSRRKRVEVRYRDY